MTGLYIALAAYLSCFHQRLSAESLLRIFSSLFSTVRIIVLDLCFFVFFEFWSSIKRDHPPSNFRESLRRIRHRQLVGSAGLLLFCLILLRETSGGKQAKRLLCRPRELLKQQPFSITACRNLATKINQSHDTRLLRYPSMTGQKKNRTERERSKAAEFRTQNPWGTKRHTLLSAGGDHEARKDLRLRHGTPEYRRELRCEFRASSSHWDFSRPCYDESCVANSSQAPRFVPLTVRPALKRAYSTGPRRVDSQRQNDDLVEKLSGLELYIQLPSRPGSVILPDTFAPIRANQELWDTSKQTRSQDKSFNSIH